MKSSPCRCGVKVGGFLCGLNWFSLSAPVMSPNPVTDEQDLSLSISVSPLARSSSSFACSPCSLSLRRHIKRLSISAALRRWRRMKPSEKQDVSRSVSSLTGRPRWELLNTTCCDYSSKQNIRSSYHYSNECRSRTFCTLVKNNN